MDKIFVAPSYKDCKILGEPFTNNKGKNYVRISIPCKRCGGASAFSYCSLYDSMCFRCNGTGVETEVVRAYTEREYNQLITAKERRDQKKIKEKAQVEQDCLTNAVQYKHELAIKLGFNEEEKTYIIFGGNTYKIKDQLKEMGARFNSILKWYIPNPPKNLPEGYSFCEISFDEVYNYYPLAKNASLKEEATDILKEKMNLGAIPSKYYPAREGERLKKIPVVLKDAHSFEGYYGNTFIYTFIKNDYTFVWMTNKRIEIESGTIVELTGTIKKFEEYGGIRQTYLSRCIIAKK